jgi:ABC-type bacteriocin/lantibiotic exporter with double-glycine peptidase domain
MSNPNYLFIIRFANDFLKPHWREGLFSLFLSLFVMVAQLIPPLFIKRIIDGPLRTGTFRQLILFVLIIALMIFLSKILKYLSTQLGTTISRNMAIDIKDKLLKHIQSVGIEYLDNFRTSSILSRIISDVECVQSISINKVAQIITNIISIIIVSIFLIRMSWMLSFLSMVFLIPLIFGYARIMKKVYTKSMELQNQREKTLHFIKEFIDGLATIKIMSGEEKKKSLVTTQISQTEYCRQSLSMKFALVSLYSGLLDLSSLIIIWGLGGYLVIQHQMTIGALVAFTQFFRSISLPIFSIFNSDSSIHAGLASCTRIYEILDYSDNAIKESTNSIVLHSCKGIIELRNVSFGYKREKPVLINLSLKLSSPGLIAITGGNGSGKSTLLSPLTIF